MSEMKNTLMRINGKSGLAEEKINKLEDGAMRTMK